MERKEKLVGFEGDDVQIELLVHGVVNDSDVCGGQRR